MLFFFVLRAKSNAPVIGWIKQIFFWKLSNTFEESVQRELLRSQRCTFDGHGIVFRNQYINCDRLTGRFVVVYNAPSHMYICMIYVCIHTHMCARAKRLNWNWFKIDKIPTRRCFEFNTSRRKCSHTKTVYTNTELSLIIKKNKKYALRK